MVEDYFGNFHRAVEELVTARERIVNATDYKSLSTFEREAQTAMRNLMMYYNRLSFWLSYASDHARRRIATGETETSAPAPAPAPAPVKDTLHNSKPKTNKKGKGKKNAKSNKKKD